MSCMSPYHEGASLSMTEILMEGKLIAMASHFNYATGTAITEDHYNEVHPMVQALNQIGFKCCESRGVGEVLLRGHGNGD